MIQLADSTRDWRRPLAAVETGTVTAADVIAGRVRWEDEVPVLRDE